MTIPTVKISTIWIGIIVAAVGNYVLISNKLVELETQLTQYQAQMVGVQNRLNAVQGQVLERTDDRFRRSDWEREEAQLNERFNSIVADTNRRLQSVDAKLDAILNRLIDKK